MAFWVMGWFFTASAAAEASKNKYVSNQVMAEEIKLEPKLQADSGCTVSDISD